jgi:hypothetical protein
VVSIDNGHGIHGVYFSGAGRYRKSNFLGEHLGSIVLYVISLENGNSVQLRSRFCFGLVQIRCRRAFTVNYGFGRTRAENGAAEAGTVHEYCDGQPGSLAEFRHSDVKL